MRDTTTTTTTTTTTQREAAATSREGEQSASGGKLVQRLRTTDGYAAQVQLLSPDGDDGAQGARDVLLTTDPSPGVAAELGATAQQLMTRWGHTLPAEALRTTKAGTSLRWSSKWGPKPVTSPMPMSLTPLDASLARGWLGGLKHWGAIGASDRGRIEAIVGGEINDRSGAARDALASQRANIEAAGDAAALKRSLETTTHGPGGYPFTLAEAVRTADRGTFTITKVEDLEEYNFDNNRGQFQSRAVRYEVRYKSASGADVGSIGVVDSHPEDDTRLRYKKAKGPTWATVEELAEWGLLLPDHDKQAVGRVELPPNGMNGGQVAGYAKFETDLTVILPALKTNVDAAKASATEIFASTFVHEAGHRAAMAKGGWGDSKAAAASQVGDGSGFGRWRAAIASDGTYVSQYAEGTVSGSIAGDFDTNQLKDVLAGEGKPAGSNVHEDFAETYAVYFTATDEIRREYDAMVPSRFALLRAEFEGSGPKRPEPKKK